MSIKILPIVDICKLVCHTLGMARFSVKTEASERLQDIFTKNVRVRMALYDIKQGTLAEALHLTQATLSTKLNRRVEWTVADIANAAVFFKEPVENLVSDSAIEAISGGSEYQLPHYAATDISRRELAAPPGIRASIPHTQTLEDERKPSPKMRPGFPLPAPIKNGAKYQLQHYVATDIFCCVSVIPESHLEHAKRG